MNTENINNLTEEQIEKIGYKEGVKFTEENYMKSTPDFGISGAAYCRGFVRGMLDKVKEFEELGNDIDKYETQRKK